MPLFNSSLLVRKVPRNILKIQDLSHHIYPGAFKWFWCMRHHGSHLEHTPLTLHSCSLSSCRALRPLFWHSSPFWTWLHYWCLLCWDPTWLWLGKVKYVKVKYVRMKYIYVSCSLGMRIHWYRAAASEKAMAGELLGNLRRFPLSPLKHCIILARIQAKPAEETLQHILSCVSFPSQAQLLQKGIPPGIWILDTCPCTTAR